MSVAVGRVLTDIMRVPGVSAVFVVSKEGFIIEKAVGGGLDIDEDAAAAMITTVYGSTSQLGEELKLGTPDTVTLEYPGHYVLLHDLGGDHMVVVIAEKAKAILGRLRYEIKKQAPRIKQSL
ncbi:MAG: roadblock/LC7 domain-containing protein [Desulfurococcales archaeon]|nr:roadblock/LC7 domain-containing protein [Desulfurococcales archaeon]